MSSLKLLRFNHIVSGDKSITAEGGTVDPNHLLFTRQVSNYRGELIVRLRRWWRKWINHCGARARSDPPSLTGKRPSSVDQGVLFSENKSRNTQRHQSSNLCNLCWFINLKYGGINANWAPLLLNFKRLRCIRIGRKKSKYSFFCSVKILYLLEFTSVFLIFLFQTILSF